MNKVSTKAKMVKCPNCKKRVFDVQTAPTGSMEVQLKCPHCKTIVAVQNITRTSCQIATYSISTTAAYLATTSGGAAKTQANVFTGYAFESVPVDILIVYDGGITP